MTLKRALYKGLAISNDIRAARTGHLPRRAARRVYGHASGRLARRIFR